MTSRKTTSHRRSQGGMRPSCAAMSLNQFSVMAPPYGVQPTKPYMPNERRTHQPLQPRSQRFKLFSGCPEGSENYIPTIISIGESSSSSSSSSSEEEDGMDIDSTSNSKQLTKLPMTKAAIDTEPTPITTKLPKHGTVASLDLESHKECDKSMPGSGNKRNLDPIVILSDDSDAETQDMEEGTKKKTKVSLDVSVKSKPPPDPLKLMNIFPESNDDTLKEFIQYGITMIDAEGLLLKLTTLPTVKTPTKVYQKDLYSQVKHGNLAKAIAYVKAGADPVGPVKSEGGRTPLHVAAAKGHLEVLLILLYKVGLTKFDCVDNTGRTPLFFAIEKKHLDIAQLLVKGGADVLVKTSEGMNLLHTAARKGSLVLVKWLTKLGIPINEQDNFGWTALMWAVESDANHSIVHHLIKLGAETDLTDKENNICLHWSASAGSFHCTRVLVTDPADSHINDKNKFGETPLHLAAKHDHYDVVQFLLLNGADYLIINKEKLTALDICPSGSKSFHSISIRNEVGHANKITYQPDISHGKERVPISCLNEVDDEPYPDDFVYITNPEESNSVTVKKGLSTVRPCKCVGICHAACKCVKLCEKQKLWYTEDGYLDLSVFEEESPVLYECTPLCTCWSYCPNRVVQKGIQFPLQVFKTHSTGWGLRTLAAIPTGAFILPYVGELITDEEAEKRNMDTYLFNLDLKTCGDEPNCMDAVEFGNCGRFINHSCKANMKAVKLFTTHRDISYPGVAFFASKHIEPKEELCFNYGNSYWDFKIKNKNGMHCKCLSDNCQYSGS